MVRFEELNGIFEVTNQEKIEISEKYAKLETEKYQNDSQLEMIRAQYTELSQENVELKKNTIQEDRIKEMTRSVFCGDNDAKLSQMKKKLETTKKENDLLKQEMKALKSMGPTNISLF